MRHASTIYNLSLLLSVIPITVSIFQAKLPLILYLLLFKQSLKPTAKSMTFKLIVQYFHLLDASGAEFSFAAGRIFAMFGIRMFKLATYVVKGTHFVHTFILYDNKFQASSEVKTSPLN